jgi:hypothetical protein
LLEIAKHAPQDGERDARPTTIRLNRAPEPGVLGRRPGLARNAPAELVRAWIRDAVEHLDRMSDTCSLDVADRGGARLTEVAELLGVTTAAIKNEVDCAPVLRAGLADFEDHRAADMRSPLAAAQDHAPGRFL